MQFQKIEFESTLYFQMLALRYDVLRKPLKLHFSLSDLVADRESLHFVGIENKQVIACLILTAKIDNAKLHSHSVASNVYKMRQVAVNHELQGKGIGKKLVQFVEAEAKRMGITHFELNARKTAVPFYLSMNYIIQGDEFEEVGIPHYKMKKEL